MDDISMQGSTLDMHSTYLCYNTGKAPLGAREGRSAPLGKAGPLRAGDVPTLCEYLHTPRYPRGSNLRSAVDVNRTEIPEGKADPGRINQQVVQCFWNILFSWF